MNLTPHEPVPFQAAQRLRQHLLRYVADLPLQRRIPKRISREDLDDDRSPFVRDAIEHDARRAAGAEDGIGGAVFGHLAFL